MAAQPGVCEHCGWPFHPSAHMETEDCDGKPLDPVAAAAVETFDSNNPHRLFSLPWYVWLEERGWVPQCFGDMPGDHVLTRAVVETPGVYLCPTCGDRWATYTEQARRHREAF